jgi:DNA ligase-1
VKQSLDTLFGLSSVGKIKQWSTWVEQNDNGTATLNVETGYIDGKIRLIPKVIKTGKNLGKKNETTPFEQALSEAQSSWNKKRDQNYEFKPMDPNNYTPRLMLPMLAKDPKKGKIIFPCYLQPKLNGVCDLAEDVYNTLHHTRGGKLFELVGHLDPYIQSLNAPAPLHGELYKHGWSLQKISSYTKKIKPDSHLLEYWIYDIAWPNIPFEDRITWIINNTPTHKNCPVKYTPTHIVNNWEEAKQSHDYFVQQGFEGAMLKNANGLYVHQFRSKHIEKMKDFIDAEFEIIGGKEGVGTDTGCIIYRCKTKDDLEFDVRPKGTVGERQEMYQDLPNVIGEMLTVRFPELNESGIPSQPIGIVVRDYE